MTMLQLNPPIPLVTPKGKADAHVLIDPGQESHLYWVCFLPNGECWTFRNPEVRLADNPTEGRVTAPKALNELTPAERAKLLRLGDMIAAPGGMR